MIPPPLAAMFLNRYTAAALAALALVAGAAWWHNAKVGAFERAINAQWEKRLEDEKVLRRSQVADWVLELAQRDAQLAQARAAAAAARRTVFRTITQEVPVYVTPLADSRCPIPNGLRWHHDAAAAGGIAALPGGAGRLVDADSGLALSTVERTVAENYGICHDLRAEVTDWRAWYQEKRAAWERLRQELTQ